MGVNITTIAYLRVLISEIGSTIILMVVEAQGIVGWKDLLNSQISPQSSGNDQKSLEQK